MVAKKYVKDFLSGIKGRCSDCEFATVLSGGGWSFLACTHKPYEGKWAAEIKDCPKNIGK